MAELAEVDARLTAMEALDIDSIFCLKTALVVLANVADLEPSLRSTYKVQPEPSQIIKPLKRQLTFAKYLRNKYVGHIHPQLITKAIEWNPIILHSSGRLTDPQYVTILNLWLLETTINTYVDDNGKHKLFDGETDLMYPPDWKRFLDFLEQAVRGSLSYLKLLDQIWAPTLVPPDAGTVDLEAYLKAGRTVFGFLKQ